MADTVDELRTDSRRLAALAAHGDGVVRDLAAEVVRLRAENESWRSLDQIRIDLLRQSRDELRRLQALIDAYAVAWHKGGWAGDTPALMAASDVLVAAATKEDDRG